MSTFVGRQDFFTSRKPKLKQVEVEDFGTVMIRKLSAEYVLDTSVDVSKIKENTCRMLINALVDGDGRPLFDDNDEARQAILSMDWEIFNALTSEITNFSGFAREQVDEAKKNSGTNGTPSTSSASA
jgi:hypothetical protein